MCTLRTRLRRAAAGNLSYPRRTVGPMALDIPRLDGRFEVVSDYQPAGDQPTAIAELERRVRARRPAHGAARRDRHRQERHHRLADRAAAAAGAGDRAQQDALRAAGQGVPRAAAEQRGRILRQLLRLLPARGLHPADRHLHREGLVGQRGGRAAAALGHDVAADPARRDRGGHRVSAIYGLGTPQEYLDRSVQAQGRRGDRPRQAAAPAGRHPVLAQRHGLPAGHVPGARRHAGDHPGVRGAGRSASSCSATRSRSSTTCTR